MGNDFYTTNEIKGRQAYNYCHLFLSGNYSYEFTKDPYCSYDVYYPAIDRADEIKFRDMSAARYVSEGYMLERGKYEELIKHRYGYYVCFFRDCFMAWDIKNMPQPAYAKILCPQTSARPEKKIWKDVVCLAYENAAMVVYVSPEQMALLDLGQRIRFKEFLLKKRRAL